MLIDHYIRFFLFFVLLGSFVSSSSFATSYFVSSSIGDDTNEGITSDTPFETISKVNGLTLTGGDNVFFKCGDIWRGDMLVLTQSGSTGSPITYSSYPSGCANKPVLSGSRGISGWSLHSSNIYVADLLSGDNTGNFPLGINQLFHGITRLPMGRWPNSDHDDGGVNFHNGYSIINSQPADNGIVDNQLPGGSWAGGTVHIKGMRWYILNRDITAASATSLTLNTVAGCWAGSCLGWGYFINNHLLTIDREGEWFYDKNSGKVYLYSVSGPPADNVVEGSIILKDDDRYWGTIVLGRDLNEHIEHVVIDNFSVINGFRNGITTPTNLKTHENSFLTIRNNHILNMDGVGIKLGTWVYDAQDSRVSGWRGGHDLTVSGNLIDGANHMGIDTYSRDSQFNNNIIRNIGVIDNLNQSGLGCGNDGSGGNCTESGDGFRIKIGQATDTGHHNSLVGNKFEEIAYNGVDVFGHNNTLEKNVIVRACITKGDCGAVRTFGRTNMASTPVYGLTLRDNIVKDCEGNTDGAHTTYRPLFGFGLYIDNYSKNIVTEGNTITGCTSHGILYQNSSGTVVGNTLYNNVNSTSWGAQLYVTSGSDVTSSQNNILYGFQEKARTLSSNTANLSNSDNNYFFNPYSTANINSNEAMNFADWQSYSGMDGNSTSNWFTLAEGAEPRSEIFINDSESVQTISLGNKAYFDLDQNSTQGSISLQPYSSQVLVFDRLLTPGLEDCIRLLRILAGEDETLQFPLEAYDVNYDGQLGMENVIGIIKTLKE